MVIAQNCDKLSSFEHSLHLIFFHLCKNYSTLNTWRELKYKFHCHFSMCSCADLMNEAGWFLYLLCASYFIIILVPNLVMNMNTIAARPHRKIPLQVKLWTCHLHLCIFNNMNVERQSDGIYKSENDIVWHIEAGLCFCMVMKGA